MPTFDFQCKKCGTVFEFERPFGSKALPACPNCKGKRTEKLMSPPMVVFKGEGFYKTDSTKKEVKNNTDTKETATPQPQPQPKPKHQPPKKDSQNQKNSV